MRCRVFRGFLGGIGDRYCSKRLFRVLDIIMKRSDSAATKGFESFAHMSPVSLDPAPYKHTAQPENLWGGAMSAKSVGCLYFLNRVQTNSRTT